MTLTVTVHKYNLVVKAPSSIIRQIEQNITVFIQITKILKKELCWKYLVQFGLIQIGRIESLNWFNHQLHFIENVWFGSVLFKLVELNHWIGSIIN